MSNLNETYPRNFDCILVDKVFDSCLKKVCFEDIKVKLPKDIDPDFCDIDVLFNNGVIKPGSLKVLESSSLPADCKRVKLTVLVSFKVIVKCNGKCFEIPGTLPPIDLDIVLFHPETRPEFKFNIIVETRSEVLDETIDCESNKCFEDSDERCTLTLAIGVFIITKVMGKVQLKLENQLEYCVPPRECKDFLDKSVCDEFDSFEFPVDFYPEQPTSVYPCGN